MSMNLLVHFSSLKWKCDWNMENQVWGMGDCYLCIFCCARVFACTCVHVWACVCVSVHVRACVYWELARAQLRGWALHIDAFPFSLLPICKICQTKPWNIDIRFHVDTGMIDIQTQSPIWKTRTRKIVWKKNFFFSFCQIFNLNFSSFSKNLK